MGYHPALSSLHMAVERMSFFVSQPDIGLDYAVQNGDRFYSSSQREKFVQGVGIYTSTGPTVCKLCYCRLFNYITSLRAMELFYVWLQWNDASTVT